MGVFRTRSGIVYVLMSWSAELQIRRLVQVRAFHFVRPMLFQVEIAGRVLSGETELWGSYKGEDLSEGVILAREAFDAAFRGGHLRFSLRMFECARAGQYRLRHKRL